MVDEPSGSVRGPTQRRGVPLARRPTRRRAASVVAGLVLVLAAMGWLGYSALAAQRHLERARSDLAGALDDVKAGDVGAAQREMRRAGTQTERARALTDDVLWAVARRLPLLGRTPDAVVTVTEVTDSLVRDSLPPLLAVAEQIDPDGLHGESASIDLAPLSEAAPTLVRANRALALAEGRVSAIRGPLPGRVSRGVQTLADQIRRLHDVTTAGESAARLLPPMLGESEPRRYLLVIQNPAEARGTGGLIGAYGVLEADQGRLKVVELGPNGDLSSALRLPVDLGADYEDLYGQDPAIWGNSNLSPHFPYAARIWLELWERQNGERLDGVVATDAVALGDVVEAVGPLSLPDGTTLTGADTADFVMKEAYRRYPQDSQSKARDQLLLAVGELALERLFSPDADLRAVALGLGAAVDEGRLQVFSTRPNEEGDLVDTPVGGTLGGDATPFLAVVANNGAANKLDVYLERSVRWVLGPCAEDGRRRTQVTLRLTNGAPRSGLPEYALGRVIRSEDGTALPRGSNRLLLTIFTSRGSRVTAGELDGKPLRLRLGRERGLTVSGLTVDLLPGQTRTLVLQTSEPAHPSPPRVDVQPLALPQRTVVLGDACPD